MPTHIVCRQKYSMQTEIQYADRDTVCGQIHSMRTHSMRRHSAPTHTYQEVLGLDVTVHDVTEMQVAQDVGDLSRVLKHLYQQISSPISYAHT